MENSEIQICGEMGGGDDDRRVLEDSLEPQDVVYTYYWEGWTVGLLMSLNILITIATCVALCIQAG